MPSSSFEAYHCSSLAVTGNRRAPQPLCRPSPAGVGRRMGSSRQKLEGGGDEGSLTEQPTKPTVTTTTGHGSGGNPTQTADRGEPRPPSRRPAPPTGAQPGGTWYRMPCSDWPGWVRPPGPLLGRIHPAQDSHTRQFTVISVIPIWLELLQTVFLVSAAVTGETQQKLTAMFPSQLWDWQTPLILPGISTSSQQDGPFKTKPKHIKALIYLISKDTKAGVVTSFTTPTFFRL